METVFDDPLQSPTEPGPAQWSKPFISSYPQNIPAGEEGLRRLAMQGAWRTVAERTQGFQSAGPRGSAEALQETAWHVLALAKLRAHGAALEVLNSVGLLGPSDLLAPDGSDRAPWMLRWLQADLPARLGRPQESADRFYSLFDFCASQLALPTTPGNGPDAQQVWMDRWRQRQNSIAAALLAHHCRAREYTAAFEWLGWALEQHPDDPHLCSRVGYLQMAVGDLNAASATFQGEVHINKCVPLAKQHVGSLKGIEETCPDAPSSLLQRNRGLLLFAQGNFQSSLKEFDSAVAADGTDTVAANNRAVCRMYACNLPGAIQVHHVLRLSVLVEELLPVTELIGAVPCSISLALEGDLRTHTSAHLHETVLLNLSSMYELSTAGAAAEAKRALSDWAGRAGPDDFDIACIRAN